MYLENIVFDSVDPQTHGRFWQELLGCAFLGEDPQGFETRLKIHEGPTLDLCFQRVPDAPNDPMRLHLSVSAEAEQSRRIAQASTHGALHQNSEEHDVPRSVLADPEGNAYYVLEDDHNHLATGPIVALTMESADVARDTRFWQWLSGWNQDLAGKPGSLRHRSGHGPVLQISSEREAKGPAKNRMHLDMRLESGDDAQDIAEEIMRHGGRELHPNWGELAWRVYQDPSGNEFCVLPVARVGNDG
ncbi:VOC family protein [Glutamicibacter sp.]|uniref:VOC family protein n=1 Tax=Glutamicibacter sp. TaxID=1931995 RepID=UPI002B474EE1|nr:VOC family protein [Glutamicibacter sp.]HJX77779.1 VOC family protein [Glutamicibacter sp.]